MTNNEYIVDPYEELDTAATRKGNNEIVWHIVGGVTGFVVAKYAGLLGAAFLYGVVLLIGTRRKALGATLTMISGFVWVLMAVSATESTPSKADRVRAEAPYVAPIVPRHHGAPIVEPTADRASSTLRASGTEGSSGNSARSATAPASAAHSPAREPRYQPTATARVTSIRTPHVGLSGWEHRYNAASVRSNNRYDDGIGVRFPHGTDHAELTVCSSRSGLKGSRAVAVTFSVDNGGVWSGQAQYATRAEACWDLRLDSESLKAIKNGNTMIVDVAGGAVQYQVDLSGSALAMNRAWGYMESRRS